MTRGFATFLFLLVALCRCDAAGKPNLDEAKANWISLLAAIAAKDGPRAQAFVGKTVCADGGRETYHPPLRLACPLPDGRKLAICITATNPSWRLKREIEKVSNWTAVAVDARAIGALHAVDVNKPAVVIEPISVEVTAAM